LILPLILAAALGGGLPIPETPTAHMQQLYARYSEPNFNPLTQPELYFTPKLAAAIEEDSRTAGGEIGYLDGDPICQCQDPAGLQAIVANERMIGADKAEVRVSITLSGYPPRPATFRLVRTKVGWRIADISSVNEPSLLRALEKSNRTQGAKHSGE
jgi:hypothetical protein